MAIRKFEAELVPKIRKLEVYAKQITLSDVIEGNWTTTFKGHGMEFSGYRSYNYGDDASLIDWKASLRSKSLLIKEYEQEKSVNVFFLFDVSNSMLFTSTKKLKAEYGAELISSLAFAVLRSGDAVGMGMFTDEIIKLLPMNVGKRMHYIIIKELGNVKNYGGAYSFSKVINQMFALVKTRAVLVIVSDFLGLEEKWYRYLRIASQRFEIIGIMIRDPRDEELPKQSGQYVLEDPYSGEVLYVDVKKYAAAYKQYVLEEENKIAQHFKATQSDFIKLTTDQEFYRPITRFFKRRALTHR